jgi:hypothetical protein
MKTPYSFVLALSRFESIHQLRPFAPVRQNIGLCERSILIVARNTPVRNMF